MEDWKIKIAMLWLFPLVGFLASLLLMLTEPSILAELLEKGTIEGAQLGAELLLAGAIIDILVPLVMAFLSLTLKDSINRWANIIVGGIYVVLEFITLLEELAAPKSYVVIMLIAAVVAPVLIVWYAWKSKKET